MDNAIRGNLPGIKIANQFAIREIIYKFGPISRLEIAERLGLTIPTITTNISIMLQRGLLKEVESPNKERSLGRKTMLIDFLPDSHFFIGIEVRGSLRRAVLTDLRGNVMAAESDDAVYADYRDALDNAALLCRRLLDSSGHSFDDCSGIGICTPGLVDRKSGKLNKHPVYHWENKDISDDFRNLTGYSGPIIAENNAIARAFAVNLLDSERVVNADTMAYMYVSNGIACPIIRDVKDHFGSVAGDGEVGHMVMDPHGAECICGNHGCLETYSSESAILSKARSALDEGRALILSSIIGTSDPDISSVIKAESMGDYDCISIVRSAIEYLGLAIANIDNLVRLDCIYIESRLFDYPENKEYLLKVIHRNLCRMSFSGYRFLFIDYDEYKSAKGAAAIAIIKELEKYIE